MALHLTVFGGLALTLGGNPLTGFASSKSPALFAYLALNPGAHPRPALAALFWGELPEDRALHNLRTALNDLRKKIPHYLLISRAEIALHLDAPLTADAWEFQTLATSSDPTELQTAVTLYRGEFLAGLQLKDAPAFDDWLTVQRERLRALALHALHRLAMHHVETEDYARGITTVRQLLAFEPWREEAHRQLMLLLARDGQYSAALHQYETCRQVLHDELGVAPLRETTALYERIRTARRGPRHKLPPLPTPFVGRARELAQIAERLANPACRLLTLTGLGGSGKTRLAIQTATNLQYRFLNGVFFVPLAGIEPSHLLPALAESLALTFREHETPRTQLLDYLTPKELLLILDNFEHLLATVTLLPEILRAAPDVKIVVTSRERLNVRAEWVLEISGMDTRPGNEDLLGLDSVQFFLSCTRQAGADAPLREGELPRILSILQKVGGLPLGIELAASWAHSLSFAEIEAEMARSLDFLATSLRDAPERQRSIRAVLDGSWRLLARDEQGILQRLAVFAGGFGQEAANQVAGAQHSILQTLTDKSLIQRSGERYTLHELTRLFLAEKLAEVPSQQSGTIAQHRRYFAAFLHTRESNLARERHVEALNEIAADIENIRAAWSQAIETGDLPSLADALEGLMGFYQARVWLDEADNALARAIIVVEKTGERKLLERLLIWRTRFFVTQSRFADARTLLQSLLTSTPDVGIAAQAAGVLAEALFRLGESGEAETRARESLRLCQQQGDADGMASALNLLGQIANRNGDYAAADSHLQQSLEIYRGVGNAQAVDNTLRLLGAVAYARGEFPAFTQDRLEAAQKSGSPARLAAALNNAGAVNYARGNHTAAEDYFVQSLELAREIGYTTLIAFNLNDLGYMRHLAGDYPTARRMFEEGLEIYKKTAEKWGVARSLNNLGMTLNALGERNEAKALLEESIAMREEMNDKRGLAYSLNDLGKVYLNEGDLLAAQKVGTRALEIFETIGNKEGIVHAHLQMGKIAQAKGAAKEAEQAFRNALGIATAIKASALIKEAQSGLEHSYAARS